jgi:threonine dehydratase
MVWVAGVDGCKAGWVAAFCDDLFETEPIILVFSCFSDILDSRFAPAIVAVDMPIGLPDRVGGSGRGPEEAVRLVLGERRNSVFSIPARGAVYAVDRAVEGMADIARSHALACDVARRTSTTGAAFSRQAFMILPKIREVDRLLGGDTAAANRVREIHPEVAFWSMNGQKPLRFGKKHASGEAERAALLQSQGLSRGQS